MKWIRRHPGNTSIRVASISTRSPGACGTYPEHIRQALDRAQAGAWLPDELRRRQATLRGIQTGLTRQRERLLEAYLAEGVALMEDERKDDELRRRQEDLARQEARTRGPKPAPGGSESPGPIDDRDLLRVRMFLPRASRVRNRALREYRDLFGLV